MLQVDLAPVDVLQAFLYSIILGASMGLFEETSVIGGLSRWA